MKLFKNIALFSLFAIFLLSSCGIFLTVHKCTTCDVSEIYINAEDHDHDHGKGNTTCEFHSDNSCCSNKECKEEIRHEENCCSDNNWFLKITEEYTFPVSKISFENKLFINVYFDEKPNIIQNNIENHYFELIKPPDKIGKNLLHFISVLIL